MPGQQDVRPCLAKIFCNPSFDKGSINLRLLRKNLTQKSSCPRLTRALIPKSAQEPPDFPDQTPTTLRTACKS